MPTTVRALFDGVSIPPTEVVPWGTRIPGPGNQEPDTGVYIVALTDDLDATDAAVETWLVSREAVEALLDARPELSLDGQRPDVDALAERLTAFWYMDEVVVYIGLAGPRQRVKVSALSDRVAEYYETPLGARSPHAGGWPIKTLANLESLFVHYAYCDDVTNREQLMLDAFAKGVSEASKSILYDTVHIMPFANLTTSGGRKAHGISGARAPRSLARRPVTGPLLTTEKNTSTKRVRSELGSSLTQSITAGDIGQGHHPCSPNHQGAVPPQPARVDVSLRGEAKNCRWHPHYDPDQERSGILGIGVVLMRRLVSEGERLAVRRKGSVVHLE